MSYTKFRDNNITEELDRQFNLFYLSLHRSKKSKGLISNKKELELDYNKVSNIAIYDIANDKTSYFFDKVEDDVEITHFLYEKSYCEEDQRITYNRISGKVKNITDIAKRELYNRVVICQLNETTLVKKLWSFKKNGEDKKLITEMDAATDWRIDAYNLKIITFKRYESKVEFNEFGY
ncbi:hypothetical protein [Chondrinema litorale]|uniref:hypothetical protein n=1 Tax=Chondrinema litorale TaxID=2994555 RepID=UPI002543EC5F|nr:hypothetical protein [Chondrinema litorale]UZR93816.1 hypothetical protein OQ292_18375 [Chondrinema litorale]